MRIDRLLALSALLFATGCADAESGSDPASDTPPGAFGEPIGVTIDVADLTVIQEMDGPSSIIDLIVDDAGYWVLSSFEPYLWRYTTEGERVLSFGAAGEGPSELSRPLVLVQPAAGSPAAIGVVDEPARAVKWYDASGEHLDTASWSPVPISGASDIRAASAVQPERIRQIGDGWVREINDRFAGDHLGMWTAHLVRLSSDGAVTDSLVDFSSLRVEVPEEPLEDVELMTLFPLAPRWDACPSRTIALLTPEDGMLHRLSLAGETLSSHPVAVDSDPMGETEIRAFFYAVAQNADGVDIPEDVLDQTIAPLVQGIAENHAGRSPPANVLCDAMNRVWVEKLDLDEDWRGYGRTWQIFEESENTGEITASRVVFPQGFRTLHIGPDRAVGVHTDEFGVMSLAWAQLPL